MSGKFSKGTRETSRECTEERSSKGNLRRKPNPKGAQAGARKRSEESDEAIVVGRCAEER